MGLLNAELEFRKKLLLHPPSSKGAGEAGLRSLSVHSYPFGTTVQWRGTCEGPETKEVNHKVWICSSPWVLAL